MTSNKDVIECSPETLLATVRSLQDEEATYVVIGGGKTGCDAVSFLAKNVKDSEKITLIQGTSLYFLSRGALVPAMTKSPICATELLGRFALGYDGTNHIEVMQQLEKEKLLVRVGDDQPKYTMHGILSQEEADTMMERAEIISNDHFVGCETSGTTKTIKFRSGKTLEIDAPKVVLVKCLSSIKNSVFNIQEHPLQADGSLKIGSQFGFTGPTGYLTTLMYARGTLDKMKFRGYNLPGKNDHNFSFMFPLAALANTLAALKVLPIKDFISCTILLDKMAPKRRQAIAMFKLLRDRKKINAQADKFLEPLEPPKVE